MKNYLIDLDGTIYRGDEPIVYAKEFIEYLNKNNRKFLFTTNCPHKSLKQLADKLNNMGIRCVKENFLNSSIAAAMYISQTHPKKTVYVIGSDALRDIIKEYNIPLSNDNPDIVLTGYDTNIDYSMLSAACRFIQNGAIFLATNCDNTIPQGNSFVPHTGAISAFIETATSTKPLFIGKPEKYMFLAAKQILNCETDDLSVIGDRLDTDIMFAKNNNMESILVLTGTIKSKDEIKDIVPDKVFNNLNELIQKGL